MVNDLFSVNLITMEFLTSIVIVSIRVGKRTEEVYRVSIFVIHP